MTHDEYAYLCIVRHFSQYTLNDLPDLTPYQVDAMLQFLYEHGEYDPDYGKPKPIAIKDLADVPAAWEEMKRQANGEGA